MMGISERKNLHALAVVAVMTSGLAVSTAAHSESIPRGADVGVGAGDCAIGEFPQTHKAYPYNELCKSMPEAEKCLAFIKQSFATNGSTVTVVPKHESLVPKAEYCLEVLKRDLGL
jgi:hypothetical protein